MSDITISNSEVFQRYAENVTSRWMELLNLDVWHIIYGKGTIISANKSQNDVILSFNFLNQEPDKKFLAVQFKQYFTIEELPESKPEFRETYEKIQQEKNNIRDFENLKIQYGIRNGDNNPSSSLFKILKKVEAGIGLSEPDLDWLNRNNYRHLSIKFLKDQSRKSKDPWELIHASKILRQWKKPEDALDITANFQPKDPQIKAIVCTTRGAAYKDLREFNKAKTLAEMAIKLQPESYYAYNLLGSIYYQLNDFEKGDQNFQKAVDFGSSPNNQNDEIINILEMESPESRRSIIRYFLKKDPQKYGWIKKYLD